MKVPPLSFRREDIPDLSTGERTDRLLKGVNAFGGDAERVINGGLTFADNLDSFTKKLEFTARDDWTALPLTAPFTAGSPAPSYRKVGARVSLRGVVTINAAASGSTVVTLGANFRPTVNEAFAVPGGAAGEYARVHVSTAGVVSAWYNPAPAAAFHLSGIAFDASDTADGRNPVFPIRIRNDLKGGRTPSHVWVTRSMDYTDGGREVPIVLGPVAWSFVKDQVQIDDIGGVLAGRKLRLTLIVVAE